MSDEPMSQHITRSSKRIIEREHGPTKPGDKAAAAPAHQVLKVTGKHLSRGTTGCGCGCGGSRGGHRGEGECSSQPSLNKLTWD